MVKITTESLKKEIHAILKNVELSKTSAKKVRQQLEKKFDTDLTDRKKEIDELVMEYVNSQADDDDEESEEEDSEPDVPLKKAKKEEPVEEVVSSEEEKPKKKAPPKKKKKDDDDADWGKKKSSGRGSGKGNGYTKALTLSPALSNLMGEKKMPRHEVVKRVWALIKERNLYDPNNKQFAICDDELFKVFGTKRFRTFGMMKYLKSHFFAD